MCWFVTWYIPHSSCHSEPHIILNPFYHPYAILIRLSPPSMLQAKEAYCLYVFSY